MPRQSKIYRPSLRNIRLLARRLQAGDIVGVPTETVYGLAADALNATACRKVFRAKGRPLQDPLIVHVSSLRQLAQVAHPNGAALRLMERFWPGPLTLVLPKTELVPSIVTAGRDSVAVRMPRHRTFRRLIAAAKTPLAAPSANPFGYLSPTTAQHVQDGLGSKIRYILDGGPARIGLESTILDLRIPTSPRLLRPGAITRAQLGRALRCRIGAARIGGATRENGKRGQVSPGLMARHYSPQTPLILHRQIKAPGPADEAFVFIRRPGKKSGPQVFWLDARGNLPAASRRLFAVLRKIDRMGFKRIHAELAAGDGLAEAINDRLRRAAAR